MNRQMAINTCSSRRLACLGIFILSALMPACMQRMAEQPYYRPLVPSKFFEDGRSARPLERGVVARGQLLDDHPLMTGLTPEARAKQFDPLPPDGEGVAERIDPDPAAPFSVKNYVDDFPIPINKTTLKRGESLYSGFCAMCHGPLGNGRGKIWERGYLKPTSFLDENSHGFSRWRLDVAMNPYNLQDAESYAPVGYIYEVITRGYGGMPSYSSQIKPEDRWSIIAYVRALQLSRTATVKDLPEDEQSAIQEQLGE